MDDLKKQINDIDKEFYFLANGECVDKFKKSYNDIQDYEWIQFRKDLRDKEIFSKLYTELRKPKVDTFKNTFKKWFDSIKDLKEKKQ